MTRVLLSHGPLVAVVVASVLTLTYCTDRLRTETPSIELVEKFSEAELRSDALSLSILASMPRFQDRGFGPLERTERQARTWMLDREASVVLFFDSASDKELSIRARSHPSLGASLPVSLALNDTPLDTMHLSPTDQDFRLVLPASLQTAGRNTLTLSAPRRRDPGDEADQRTLVAAFSRIDVRPIGSEASPGWPRAGPSGIVLRPHTSVSFYLHLSEGTRLRIDGQAELADSLRVRLDDDEGSEQLPVREARGGVAFDHTLVGRAGPVFRFQLSNTGARGNITIQSVTVDGPALEPSAVERETPPNRPNIIVYLVDTLRADYLGAYGFPAPTSPRFDAFASESILFEDAWAQASWTRPAVASIFTGLHPGTHRADTERRPLPPTLDTLAERLKRNGYRTGAFVGNYLLGGRFGFDQGFDTWNDEDPSLYGGAATLLGERALEWIDQDPAPFFAYVHTMDPHSPYEPPQSALESIPGEPYDGNRNTTALLRLGQLGELDPAGLEFLKHRYQGEIRHNDEAFGVFLDALAARGLLDNTLIVFTSDHGEEFVEHDGTEHGKSLYQEVVHIPLAIRPPGGLATGRRVGQVVEQIDLLPTLLGFAGAPPDASLPGRDLSRLRSGGVDLVARPVVYAEQRFGLVNKYSARTGVMKLIVNHDGVEPELRFELYDLAADPGERSRLNDTHPVTLAYLDRQLERFREVQAAEAQRLRSGSELTLTGEELDQLKALGYIQ